MLNINIYKKLTKGLTISFFVISYIFYKKIFKRNSILQYMYKRKS